MKRSQCGQLIKHKKFKEAKNKYTKSTIILPFLRSHSLFFFFKLFRAILGSWQNWVAGTLISRTPPAPAHAQPPPWPPTPPEWYVATTDEPILTHQYHLKSILYVRIHSWYCTFSGCGWIYEVCIHHHSILQSHFTALKILCPLPSYLFPLTPGNHTSFNCLCSFAFCRMSCHWDHTEYRLFRLLSFNSNIYFSSLCFHSSFVG